MARNLIDKYLSARVTIFGIAIVVFTLGRPVLAQESQAPELEGLKRRPALGVVFYFDVPLNLSKETRVIVRYVDVRMPASRVGLRHGDVVTAVNTERMSDPIKLSMRLHELLDGGECVAFRISRNGQERDLLCIRGEIRDGPYFAHLKESAEESAPILNIDGRVHRPGDYSMAGTTIDRVLSAAGVSSDASTVCFTLLERATSNTEKTCQPYRGGDIPGLQPKRSYIVTFQ
jgi:hypothetical protein